MTKKERVPRVKRGTIPEPKQVHPITALKPRGRGDTHIQRRRFVHDAKAVEIIEKRYQAVELRRDGYTIKQIADTMQIGLDQARNLIVEALNFSIEKTNETIEEHRQLQVERLDKLLSQYMPMAAPGVGIPGANLGAAMMVLSVEARRAKLLALDVPETKKHEITAIREYVGIDPDDVVS